MDIWKPIEQRNKRLRVMRTWDSGHAAVALHYMTTNKVR